MNVAPVVSQLEIYRFINAMWSKGHDVTTPNGEVPYELLWRSCFYCPNLITVARVARDIGDLSKSHDYDVMISLAPDAEYPIEPFEWGLPAIQVWCF